MSTWGLVLAAGTGRRFGTVKQFEKLGGITLVERSVRLTKEVCDGVCLVLPAEVAWSGSKVDLVVTGGASHAESTRAGLAELPASADAVFITAPSHPLVSAALAIRVLDALRTGVDAAAPMLPLVDSPKVVVGDRVVADEASATHVAQLPFGIRREALDDAIALGLEFREELEAVAAIGGRIVAVDGDPRNVHVTTPAELAIAEALLEAS